MKVLITGGCGFVGSHLTERFLKEGYEVVVVDNLSSPIRNVHGWTASLDIDYGKKFRFIWSDIRDKDRQFLYEGADYLIHLAAMSRIQPSIEDPTECHSINVTGTLDILNLARKYSIKKVVLASSSSIYGDSLNIPSKESDPVDLKNPYSCSKYMGELYCKLFASLYGLQTTCLRLFNVYGPRQPMTGAYATVIGIFLRQVSSGEPMTIVGNGTQRRDFTYVTDVVDAFYRAITRPTLPGDIFNIGTGINYSVNEIAEMIQGSSIFIPSRPGEALRTQADYSRSEVILEWKPKVGIVEGINLIRKGEKYDS